MKNIKFWAIFIVLTLSLTLLFSACEKAGDETTAPEITDAPTEPSDVTTAAPETTAEEVPETPDEPVVPSEPIEPENKEANKKAIEYIENLNGNKMIAFAIGFPGLKDTGKTKKYKVNKTYYQLNMLDEPDEIVDDEE